MTRLTSVLLATLLSSQSFYAATSSAQSWEIVDVGPLDIGSYTDVWGASERAVFITGSNGILHYDGNEWREMAIPPGITCCNAIWGISDRDAYATGVGVLLHYNGSSWSEVNIGPSQGVLEARNLIDVWAGSGGDGDRVVVLGDGGRYFVKTGSTWTTGGTSVYPNVSVRGDESSYLRTYWYPSTVLGDPYSYRGWWHDGADWRFLDRSQKPGAVFHYGWATGLGTETPSIVGVGNNITARYDENNDATVIDSPVSWDSSFRFYDLTGTPGSIYALGHNGFYGSVLKFDGAGWTDMSPIGPTLFGDIWGSHGSDLWALTPTTIWHYGNSVSVGAYRLAVDIVQTITEPDRYTQGKPIHVRAYVVCPGCPGNSSGNATVTLDFEGAGRQQISKSVQVMPGKDLDELRMEPSSSFNFTIPASDFAITAGTVEKAIDLGLTGTIGGESVDRTWTRNVTIEYLRPLRVGIVWIYFTSGGTQHYPTFEDERLAFQFMRELYPGEIEFRFLGSFIEADIDGIGGLDVCDKNCLAQAMVNELSDLFVLGVLSSELYQGIDYIHGLIPNYGGLHPLAVGGLSDPYWVSDGALGYASIGPRFYVAHEVGHNLGLHHPGWDPQPFPEDPFRYEGVCPSNSQELRRIAPSADDPYAYLWTYDDPYIHAWGWDGNPDDPVKPAETYFDFMGYCGDLHASTIAGTLEWISDVHYDRLLMNLEAPPPLAPATGAAATRRVGRLPADRATFVAATEQTYSVVEVLVNDDDTVDHLQAATVTGEVVFPSAPATPDDGDYCVVREDSGFMIDRQCFTVPFMDEDLEPRDHARFRAFFAYDDATTHVKVKKGAQTLATLQRSPTAPAVSGVTATPLGDNRFTVCWTGTDGDGGDLSYDVLYSPDSGDEWLPVSLSPPGPCVEVDLNALPASTAGMIRVTASDGFNSGHGDAAGTIAVTDAGPTIYLAHGELIWNLEPGDRLLLAAEAIDAEDGDLPTSAIVWRNASGGEIGRGDVLVTISEDVQRYTVTATDSQSNAAVRSVELWQGGPPPIFRDGFEGGA